MTGVVAGARLQLRPSTWRSAVQNKPLYPNRLAAFMALAFSHAVPGFAPRRVATGGNSNNSLGNFLRSRERVLWNKRMPYVRAKHGSLS